MTYTFFFASMYHYNKSCNQWTNAVLPKLWIGTHHGCEVFLNNKKPLQEH